MHWTGRGWTRPGVEVELVAAGTGPVSGQRLSDSFLDASHSIARSLAPARGCLPTPRRRLRGSFLPRDRAATAAAAAPPRRGRRVGVSVQPEKRASRAWCGFCRWSANITSRDSFQRRVSVHDTCHHVASFHSLTPHSSAPQRPHPRSPLPPTPFPLRHHRAHAEPQRRAVRRRTARTRPAVRWMDPWTVTPHLPHQQQSSKSPRRVCPVLFFAPRGAYCVA